MILTEGLKSSRDGHTKCVAILGFAETYKQAPFDDPSVEIWGLNELHKYVPRWDRWFEQHDKDTLGITKRDLSEGEQKRHIAWLSRDHGDGKVIYMQDEFCTSPNPYGVTFPNARPYPLEAMCAEFGRYFTSTIGYMLALAISEGYTWIGLYGIDLASDVEYPQQRPNAEWLVGVAHGMGRTVVIPPQSAMLKAGALYGYELPATEAHGTLKAIQSHKDRLVKEHEKQLATLHTIDGAIQECENVIKLLQYTDRGTYMETY